MTQAVAAHALSAALLALFYSPIDLADVVAHSLAVTTATA
jgi:hypothetical protein